MKRTVALLLALALSFVTLVGCGEKTPTARREFTAMDTVCSISLYDNEDQALLDACVALVNEREMLWSRTIDTSDIAAVNAGGGVAVAVDAKTASLLETAAFYGVLTEGAFDITTASLTDLWKASEVTGVAPDAEQLSSALSKVGVEKLGVSGDTVMLTNDARIDLGGIGKGQVADEVASLLKERGCASAVVDFGGNIVAVGDKNGKPFHIGIAHPQQSGEIIATVAVSDRAVVTSGSYERGFTVGDKRYSHVIDPATGMPVDNDLLSITIIAPLAVDADVLSTACFVMGFDKATAFLDGFQDVEAVFVKADGSVVATDGITLV